MADTVTYTVPEPGGTTRVISDDERTCTLVASLLPKRTDTGPTKLLPRIVTFVPPLLAPAPGDTCVIVGGST